MKPIARPVSSLITVALSAGALLSFACDKTTPSTDSAGETHTTAAPMEAPLNPAPMNAPSLGDTKPQTAFPANNAGSAAAKRTPGAGTLGATTGDTSGAPLGAADEKARDDSYGGSANGGSSGPATGGGVHSLGSDAGRAGSSVPAKPGHILPPGQTTDLPR